MVSFSRIFVLYYRAKVNFHFRYLTFLLLLFACDRHDSQEKIISKKTPQEIDEIVSDEIANLLEKKISDSVVVVCQEKLIAYPFFSSFFENNSALVWTKGGSLNPLGESLTDILRDARYFGLFPPDYHIGKIDSLLKFFTDQKNNSINATAVAETELLLSDAYIKMAVHIHRGRFLSDTLLLSWNAKQMPEGWIDFLKNGVKKNKLSYTLEQLEPKKEGYRFLISAFRKYYSDNAFGDFDSVAVSSLEDSIPLLKSEILRRFSRTGEYDSSVSGSDSIKFIKAMKCFQRNWHLEPDGKIGKLTRQALQYNREKIFRQIEMAIERWKWEPDTLPEKFFWINLPSFNLKVMENDTLVMESNIVCGKPETPTPLLRSKINYMTIYPYWNVPYSIAAKEILPAVQRDTSYLRKKNMEVLNSKNEILNPSTIKWKRFNEKNLPYKFRQRIGEDNSLGVVKFNFNNPHGVYLHDTNSKRYFKTAARSQSHGCIRLEKYVEVARFLLRDDTLKLPYDTLDVYLATPQQRKINLKSKVPIFTKYFTATADSLGNLDVFLDIYRKDEAMMKMIYR